MPHSGRRSCVWKEATRYSESHLPPNAGKMVTQSILPCPCACQLDRWLIPVTTPRANDDTVFAQLAPLPIPIVTLNYPHTSLAIPDPRPVSLTYQLAELQAGMGEWGRGKRPVFATAPNRYYPIFLHPHYWYDAIEYCYIMINLAALMANWVMIWMRKG